MAEEVNRPWMSFIPESAANAHKRTGFVGKAELKSRSALVIVDVTLGFMGSPGSTAEQAQQEYPTGTGPIAWETLPRIARLLDCFRSENLPAVFTRMNTALVPHLGNATMRPLRFGPRNDQSEFNRFPAEITPQSDEYVIDKSKASSFFDTPLAAYLTRCEVGTVVICGVGTSGCVRATATDAFSHGYQTVVVDDCCFDRTPFSHATNLFDMNGRYATILSGSEVIELLRAKPESRPLATTNLDRGEGAV